ncbi:hypothetical protein GX563_05685 [Candidatus Bathyarchaeota archaeon]|nr:hypothetical protein [Candidatus Bathyarchaeota archaeon]
MVSEKTKKVKEAPKKFEWQIGESHYYVDKSIVRYTAPTKNPLATHGKEIGILTATYGLVKGSPGITTVGVTKMSQPNTNEKGWIVRWKDVREVKADPEKSVIMLKEKLFTGGLGGGIGKFCIYCLPEMYSEFVSACQGFCKKTIR